MIQDVLHVDARIRLLDVRSPVLDKDQERRQSLRSCLRLHNLFHCLLRVLLVMLVHRLVRPLELLLDELRLGLDEGLREATIVLLLRLVASGVACLHGGGETSSVTCVHLFVSSKIKSSPYFSQT